MPKLKMIAAMASVFALVIATFPADAFAGYRGHYYGGNHYRGHHYKAHHYRGHHYRGHHYRGHRYHGGYKYRRGHSHAWVPFAVLGAGIIGYAIADSQARSRTTTTTTYSSPPPAGGNTTGYSSGKPCHVAYRDEDQNGQMVRMAATMCYDSAGTAYIVQGSEHQVPYE